MIDQDSHKENQLVVIDFETCDTKPSSQVLTLGATVFNPTIQSTVDHLAQNTFYIEFEEQDNRTFSIDTLAWWILQSKEAQNAAFNGKNKQPAPIALTKFNQWLEKVGATHLIGNGASFDNPMLSSLYDQYQIEPVLRFWRDLDLRTMRWLKNDPIPWPDKLIQHNAGHDAIYEAMCFQNIYKQIIT